MENDLKINGDVAFQEEGHKYFNLKDPTIKYTSVTTLIGKYEQPFDSKWVSRYKAVEKLVPADVWKRERGGFWKNKRIPTEFLEVQGVTEEEVSRVQQELLDEWAATTRESCERGTKIHAAIEQSFYKAGDAVNLQKFGIGGKFVCKKDYSDLDLEYGVYPEYLIYYDSPHVDLHLAGQIDLIVKSGNDITLIDHKTNAEIKLKGFFNQSTKQTKKMKYPLGNIDDCNYWHYTLQLSTYAWMLQKLRPEFIIKDLILNHYDHDGKNTLYHCEYRKDDVEKMLKHYAKMQQLEKQKQKYARIEY